MHLAKHAHKRVVECFRECHFRPHLRQNWRNASYSCQTLACKASAVPDQSQVEQQLQTQRSQPYGELGPASTSTAEAEEDGIPTVQLSLPEPRDSRVKSATFIKSSVKTADCPPAKYPEFAVVGRSNVGKSSLINMLTNRKSLAMVSKEPGKHGTLFVSSQVSVCNQQGTSPF
jgi:hypothetical protein